MFDAQGMYVRSIGRQGEGPGELQFPGAQIPASFVLRDGIISVAAPRRGVTVRFATDGTLVDEISTATLSPRGIALGGTPDGGTLVWELVNERTLDYMLTNVRIRIFDPNGEAVTAVTAPSIPTAAFRTLPSEERPVRTVLNYSTWPEVQLLNDDRILLAPGTEPVLQWYDLAGTLVRQARFDISMEITAEDRARVELALDRAISTGGEQATMWRAQKERLTFADRKAPWSATRVDDAGFVWLFKTFATVSVGSGSQHPFEVMLVSPAGEYLGDTTLPMPMTAASILGTRITGGSLLTLVDDPETGESVPTVFRIHSTVEGFAYPE